MHVLAQIAITFHILGLLSSIAAIMNTRTSQGSIAWAISLNTLPYLAVPAYWIFGRNRFNGYVASKREFTDSIDEFTDQVVDEVGRHTVPDTEKNAMMRAAESLVEFPILKDNAWSS